MVAAMDRKSLMKEWPKNAEDLAGAVRLLKHGYPTLEPVLPDIVHWVKTSGPVADLFCKFLAELGEHAVEPVRLALKGTHDEQILKLLRDVMPGWPVSALLASAHELELLLQRGSVYGLNIFALALLVRAQAETHAPAHEWAGLFRERLNVQLEALDEIESRLIHGSARPL
jgi:hypothetical protein